MNIRKSVIRTPHKFRIRFDGEEDATTEITVFAESREAARLELGYRAILDGFTILPDCPKTETDGSPA